jgi:hypothetical protein
MSEPDRIQTDTEHETSSQPPYWRRTYPSILEKEVNRMNISCVHRNVPKDLSLAMKERNHLSLPHLVVLHIKV